MGTYPEMRHSIVMGSFCRADKAGIADVGLPSQILYY
jgi:hypothetical protein